MKIALLSDIHDHIWNLKKALETAELQNTDAMLFCGDLCAPFIIKLLGQGYSKPIHLVLGNNDGDVASIIANANSFSHIHIHGEYFKSEFDNKTFAMNHYPDKARKLAEHGAYDVVCYGHNHVQAEESIGSTLVVNPGTIMGFHGGSLEEVPATFMTLETATLKTKVVRL
jgi:putative phosphoesterase